MQGGRVGKHIVGPRARGSDPKCGYRRPVDPGVSAHAIDVAMIVVAHEDAHLPRGGDNLSDAVRVLIRRNIERSPVGCQGHWPIGIGDHGVRADAIG